MVSNDLQWPRSRDLRAPGAWYMLQCYIINPRADQPLFTASPHADNVIYTCRYSGFSVDDGRI